MKCSLLRPATLITLLVCAFVGFTTTARAQAIRVVSAPGEFYGDTKSGNGIAYNYAAYTISNNTGVNLPSVYVAITNIVSTNRIQLAANDPGVRALGALASGQVKMAAFYLMGPALNGGSDSLAGLTNEVHTIRVLNGPPGSGSVLSSSSFGFSNITYVIEALANQVTIITNLNPYAVLGSIVPLVIGGKTGTIGSPPMVAFSPAVLGSWRPDAYELESSLVVFDQNPNYTNLLYFSPATPGFTNYANNNYTNTYYFRASKVTGTNVALSPFGFIASGSQVKHTALSSLAGLGVNYIVSVTNAVFLNHTVSPVSLYAPGGTVTYSITVSNTSSYALTLDEIVDTLPGTPGILTFVPNSATYNSIALTNPSISGQTLRWALPLSVAANSSSVLTFQALAPLPAGPYTNSVIGIIGGEIIDSTLSTTDTSPSLSVFTVIPVADLGVTKAGPASVYAATNFSYTITVTNFGPSPASSLSVTDALPANATFISSIPAATLMGNQLVWTNLGSLAANARTNLIVTVQAGIIAATMTNSASGGSPTIDFNLTNNASAPVFTTVTPVADVGVFKTAAASVAPNANFNYTIAVTNFGPSLVTSVTVTDALPASVSFVGASGGGVLSGGNVIWNMGGLPVGAGTNFTLTVSAPAHGTLTNSASVGSTPLDINPANNTTLPVVSTVSNVPPVAVNDTAATPKNIPVTIPVLANDSDATGDPLTIVAVTQTNGLASISGTNVVFAPATNYMGTVVLTYTISDGFGGTNSALITISVTNRPPVAVNDTVTGTNGVPQIIYPLANDSDPDGDPLTITNVTGTGGLIVINPGSTNITFTPTNNTTAILTYTISDGSGGSASATITVLGINQNPIANDDTATTSANVPVLISPLVNDSDPDGNPISITGFSPTNGTAQIVGVTNIFFTPDTNFDGTATVGYTISDGLGGTASAVITITVSQVADIAAGKSASASVLALSNLVYTISVTNLGPTSASSVVLTDALPAGVTFLSASGSGANNSGIVNWNLGTLTSGQVSNVTVTVTAPASGSLTNVASVSSPAADPDPTNNVTLPVTTTVTEVADVAVGKSGPAGSVYGTSYTYTISVTNFGPSTATSLTVTDSLPAGLVFVSAVPAATTNAANQVIWSGLGDLIAGGTTNLTLMVNSTTSGSVSNIASAGSPTLDPNPTNNVTLPVVTEISLATALVTWPTPTNIVYGTPLGTNQNNATSSVPGGFAYNPTNGTVLPVGTNLLSVIYTPTDTNYSSTNLSVLLVVTPTSLTVTADNQGKFYGQTLTLGAGQITFTSSGLVNGDGVTSVTLASAGASGGAAAGGYPLVPSAAVGSGLANYSITYSNGLLTVSLATALVTWPTPTNIVYGTLLGTNQNNATSSVPGTFTYNPTNGTVLPVGTNILSVIYSPTDTNYATTNLSVVVVVTPALLTVTADNQSKVYGATLTLGTGQTTFTSSGLVNGDTVTSVTLASAGAVSGATVGSYPLVPSAPVGSGLTNYSIVYSNGLLTVSLASTLVTWPMPTNIVYGTPLGTNQNNATSTVPGTFTYNPTNGTVLPVGTNLLTVLYTPADTNYNSTNLSVLLVVTPASLTVTANNQSKVYGQTLTLGVGQTMFTSSGLVNGDTVTSVTLASAGASSGAAVGSYSIVPSAAVGGGLTNYSIAYSNGLLTVSAATPLVMWPVPSDIVYGTPLGTNQNGAASSVPGGFVYNPTNGTVLPVGTNLLSVIYTPTDTNYSSTNLSVLLVVTPASLTVTANNQSKVYGQTLTLGAGQTTFASSGLVSGDTVTSVTLASTGASGGAAVGSYPIVPSAAVGSGLTNYSINYSNAVLTVSVAMPVVTWPVPTSIGYGTPLGTNQNGATSTVPGGFVYNPTNGTVLPVGTNLLTVLYTPADTNYSSTNLSVLLVVTPASLTVTANNASRAFGQTNPVFSGIISGLQNSDNITATYATTATTNSPTGGYPIIPTLVDPNSRLVNYSVITNNGTLTVTNATLTGADIAVLKTGPTNGLAGSNLTYTITVTNLGPFTSTNVVVKDRLPAGFTFVSAVPATATVVSNVVTWPGFNLANGARSNFTVTAVSASGSTATNIAFVTANTFDPNPANNDGSSPTSQARTIVAAAQFTLFAGPTVLNPQTGLYEETVIVTNTGAATVPGIRLYVGGLRTDVTLYNAAGTTNGLPYVQYNSSVNASSHVTFLLEFYNPNRLAFTNTLTAVVIQGTNAVSSGTNGVAINLGFMDTRLPGDTRFVIEFASIPGKTYTILYSTNLVNWMNAVPSITANANITQWYDDGPPKTVSKPESVSSRYYRVIQN